MFQKVCSQDVGRVRPERRGDELRRPMREQVHGNSREGKSRR